MYEKTFISNLPSTSPTGPSASAPARILFIRWKSIGDIVQTLPAWNTLRKTYPQAHIAFMTSSENAALVRLFPGVDEVLAFDRRALFLLRNVRESFATGWRTIWRSTLGGNFDLVVDLQGYGETAHLTFLSGARQRWGLLARSRGTYAYTSVVERNPDVHTCDNFFEVLKQNGLPARGPNRLAVPAAHCESARHLLTRLGLDANPHRSLLCLQPLTTNQAKNWPLEKYAELAAHAEKEGFQVVSSGGAADRQALQQSPLGRWPIACGQDLATSCGLVAHADIVVGGDTGLTHLALAVGTRIIMILRDYSRARTGPYERPDWAVCGSELAALPIPRILQAFDEANAEKRSMNGLLLAR